MEIMELAVLETLDKKVKICKDHVLVMFNMSKLYTLTSVCIFPVLFSIHFLWY